MFKVAFCFVSYCFFALIYVPGCVLIVLVFPSLWLLFGVVDERDKHGRRWIRPAPKTYSQKIRLKKTETRVLWLLEWSKPFSEETKTGLYRPQKAKCFCLFIYERNHHPRVVGAMTSNPRGGWCLAWLELHLRPWWSDKVDGFSMVFPPLILLVNVFLAQLLTPQKWLWVQS